MGKSTINGPFSIAMLVYQRVMDDNGMYIANNVTGVGPENGGYAFHFMAI